MSSTTRSTSAFSTEVAFRRSWCRTCCLNVGSQPLKYGFPRVPFPKYTGLGSGWISSIFHANASPLFQMDCLDSIGAVELFKLVTLATAMARWSSVFTVSWEYLTFSSTPAHLSRRAMSLLRCCHSGFEKFVLDDTMTIQPLPLGNSSFLFSMSLTPSRISWPHGAWTLTTRVLGCARAAESSSAVRDRFLT